MLVRPPAQRWKDTSGFMLAAIGTAMGLEGLATLPVLALRHGGGAFLIAYLVAIAVTVLPVMTLEVGVGVCFQASAPGGLRRLSRKLEWIGWWTTGLGALAAGLVALATAWGLLLAGEAFLAVVGDLPTTWSDHRGAAAAWWAVRVKPSNAGVMTSGGMLLALLAVWSCAGYVLSGGLAAIGRWCTVLVPLAMALLLALGVGFLYQVGAVDGVSRYLMPDWSALAEGATWSAAVRAAFVTQALGVGIYIAFASHLERGADAGGSAVIIALAGAGFAFLAGFVGCAVIGALAAQEGVPISALLSDSPFDMLIVLTAAMGVLPLPVWGTGLMSFLAAGLWALLGFSTLLGLLSAVIVAITDTFAVGWERALRRVMPIGFIIVLLLAAPVCSEIVADVRQAFFPTGVAIAVAAQCMALMAVASASNLQRHINAYSSFQVGPVWRLLVVAVIPAMLLATAAERILAIRSQVDAGLLLLLPGLTAGGMLLLLGITFSLMRSHRRVW